MSSSTADPGEDLESNFGFDWSFDNGVYVIAEVRTRRRPFGRPGRYGLGGSFTPARLETRDLSIDERGTCGLYAFADQMLPLAAGDRPGFGLFLRGYGRPQTDRNFVKWYVDAGFKLTRPLPGRAADVLSLGFAHLRFSEHYVGRARGIGLPASCRESVLELTYRLRVTGWLTLQPDLQFVFDPHLSRRDATVIGPRAVIEM